MGFQDAPDPNDPSRMLLYKIAVADESGGGAASGSGLPYGADEQVITNDVAGPTIIVFKLSGATLKTRTITYDNPASASGQITHTVDS